MQTIMSFPTILYKMSRIKVYICLLLLLPLTVVAQSGGFPYPDVPKSLKTPAERANYLALHYWDNVDFTNDDMVGNKEISEQGFSNFISIMPYVTEKEAAFEQFASRIAINENILDYFVAIGEKYLAEPLSPVYDESLYILLLEKIVGLEVLPERAKENYMFDLKMARKNRLGTKATDFKFVTKDGRESRLLNVKAEYLLLFLGDPECDFCNAVKTELLASKTLRSLLKSGRVKVLSVCVEGRTDAWLNTPASEGWIDACDEEMAIHEHLLYDIPGLPLIYLLDGNHNILLKNVTAGQVERFLENK